MEIAPMYMPPLLPTRQISSGSNDPEKQTLLEVPEERPQGLLRSLAAPFAACIGQCLPTSKTDELSEKNGLQEGRKKGRCTQLRKFFDKFPTTDSDSISNTTG